MKILIVLALLPLSGGSAHQGRWIQQGLELAALEIQKSHPHSVNLIFEDSGGSAQQAIAAYRLQRLRSNIPAVITWGSGIGLALSPIVNRDEVLQMGVATAVPEYSKFGDFNFRNFPSAEKEAEFLSRVLYSDLKMERLAILAQNNDYGLSSAQAFRSRFSKLGGEVLFEDSLETGHTDFRTQLLRMKQSEVEVVYLASYSTIGALVLKQARALGVTAIFVASVAILGDREFFEQSAGAAEGLLVVTPDAYARNSESKVLGRFQRAYRERYGVSPGVGQLYAARAYDALHLLHRASLACASQKTDCMRDWLHRVRGHDGASGLLNLDGYGDVQTQFQLTIVRNREFVPYSSVERRGVERARLKF